MINRVSDTLFAPDSRSLAEEVGRQHALLEAMRLGSVLDAVLVPVVVLNANREIVLANARAVQIFAPGFLGKRFGEALDCVHSGEGPGGCGATEFCSRCGGVSAILQGLSGASGVEECNLLRRGPGGLEAMDLLVRSAPFHQAQERFVIVSAMDVSHEKRRRILERLFFHDALNTAGAVKGLLDLLRKEVPETLRPGADFIHACLVQMTDDILAQREILAAESNELPLQPSPLISTDLLDWASMMGANLSAAKGKTIAVDPACGDIGFVGDVSLVKRILANMVKNALEASGPGDEVVLGCREQGPGVEFWVRNAGEMSQDVRLKVFSRGFSTKGGGRGLGTYGMKLLAERYMGGAVSFESSRDKGTTFTVWLPCMPAAVSGS